jgi:hypothetical protein
MTQIDSDDLIGSGNGGAQVMRRHRGHPGGSRVPEDETREEQFVRLALERMPKLQRRMKTIANLASYPYTSEQRDKIMREIHALVAEVEAAFNKKQGRDLFHF